MQPRGAETASDSAQAHYLEPPEGTGGAVIQTEAARSREEMNMLFIGFGLGLSIGFIFLVYIVLAIAGLFH